MKSRLLLDACLSPRARDELRSLGHDVIWAGDGPIGTTDEALLAQARNEGRITATLDRDFGELVVVRGLPHAGILRLVGFPSSDQARVIALALERHAGDLLQGALVTVEPGRVRVRPGADDETT